MAAQDQCRLAGAIPVSFVLSLITAWRRSVKNEGCIYYADCEKGRHGPDRDQVLSTDLQLDRTV